MKASRIEASSPLINVYKGIYRLSTYFECMCALGLLACRGLQCKMKLFCFHFLSLFVFFHSVASQDTRLAFHSFSAEDGNFITLRDAAHNGANRTYIINGRATQSRGTCGALVYGKKVRIQDVAAGRVFSYSTSFSFTFDTLDLPGDDSSSPRDKEENSMAFIFVRDTMLAKLQGLISEIGSSGACKTPNHPSDPNHRYTRQGFLVAFGMGKYNPDSKDPSNCYIRVAKTLEYEYDIGAYTHNLCGNDTYCSYFSDGKVFTAWIDFNSSARTLEVRLANGSNPSVKKPLEPMLRIPDYTLPELFGDYVYPSFWGSSDVQRVEAHELLSWRFFSTTVMSKVPSSQTPNHVWKARTWAGISTGVAGMVVAAAVVILWSISRLGSASRSYRYTALDHIARPHVFSYAELRKATHNFDERNLLGKGGSGSVYKGSFEGPGGVHLVAVKQINFSEPKQAESLFQAEVASLCQIRHRNVVQLQGWCQEKGRLLLVYDFMPNGGLNEWLHTSASQEIVLSLKMRHSILEGVGLALEYLHEDCSSCVLHRDIKSSNVLLDANFKAHLGDFGLAWLMDHHKLDKTTLAAGTLGYMAPELPYTGKATKESDVYSFGILVLEVVCGRHPLDMQASKPEDLVLLHMVWRAHEGGSLLNVVDSRLFQTLQPLRFVPHQKDELTSRARPPSLPLDSNIGSGINVLGTSMIVDVDVEVYTTMVVDLLRLGLWCCLPNPKARPSIGQVNGILQQIRDMENLSSISNITMPLLPTTKPLGLFHSLEFSQTSLSLSSSSPPISIACG